MRLFVFKYKIMKLINIIIFTILISIKGYCQQDSLIIFTKKGCSNCAYTKTILKENKINFIELGVENKTNAKNMLNQLKEIGYEGKIYMPIIFLNNEIYHPVYETDTSLTRITLKNALDSIIFKYEAGLISPIKDTNKKITNNTNDINNDCEINKKQIYLMGENFKDEEKAILFVNKLKDEGYINSGLLYYQNYYRVYYDIFLDVNKANIELNTLRKQNKISYLFYEK